MKRPLTDRVALVTGAGKGLGRAYARELSARGARVLVNNRLRPGRENSADAVVAEIIAAGGEAAANYEAVEGEQSGQRLVADAMEKFGRLDIVLANAGVDEPASFHKQSREGFENIFEINFMGTARLLHAAWPLLREARYGRVLVSSSTAGLYGNHGQAAYSASKAALLGLMRALSIEGASRNVLVNAIAPYAVTPLTRPWFPPRWVEQFSPQSVAELACWMLSDHCKLSGKTLIAGAGHVRLARVLETETVSLGEDLQSAMSRLLQLNPGRGPDDANAEFEEFGKSLPSNGPGES